MVLPGEVKMLLYEPRHTLAIDVKVAPEVPPEWLDEGDRPPHEIGKRQKADYTKKDPKNYPGEIVHIAERPVLACGTTVVLEWMLEDFPRSSCDQEWPVQRMLNALAANAEREARKLCETNAPGCAPFRFLMTYQRWGCEPPDHWYEYMQFEVSCGAI